MRLIKTPAGETNKPIKSIRVKNEPQDGAKEVLKRAPLGNQVHHNRPVCRLRHIRAASGNAESNPVRNMKTLAAHRPFCLLLLSIWSTNAFILGGRRLSRTATTTRVTLPRLTEPPTNVSDWSSSGGSVISSTSQVGTSNRRTIAGLSHVAIIPDGNGRWAEARGLPREVGHARGGERFKEVVDACRDALRLPLLAAMQLGQPRARLAQQGLDLLARRTRRAIDERLQLSSGWLTAKGTLELISHRHRPQ